MLLGVGVPPMFCFGILRIFGENHKSAKIGKSGIIGNPRRGINLRQGVGYPRRGEAEVPDWNPSGTPQHSIAAPWRSYCSQRAIFGFLFLYTSYSYTDSLETLIKV